MDLTKAKNEFIELIKLAPDYGKTQRILSYILALITIIVFMLFPIFADLIKNGHIFSSICTALLVGYICVFMKYGYYYLFSTKTYDVLVRPSFFGEHGLILLKKINFIGLKP